MDDDYCGVILECRVHVMKVVVICCICCCVFQWATNQQATPTSSLTTTWNTLTTSSVGRRWRRSSATSFQSYQVGCCKTMWWGWSIVIFSTHLLFIACFIGRPTTVWQLKQWLDYHNYSSISREELLFKRSDIVCVFSSSSHLLSVGMIDCPGTQDGSSLRSLIEKPPVCGNSFSPLTGALLTGFRLHTGPVGTGPHCLLHTHAVSHTDAYVLFLWMYKMFLPLVRY